MRRFRGEPDSQIGLKNPRQLSLKITENKEGGALQMSNAKRRGVVLNQEFPVCPGIPEPSNSSLGARTFSE